VIDIKRNYAEHIVKGSTFIFLISVAATIIGYLTRIFLARTLTPADYGLVYASLSLFGVLNIFRNMGFSETLRKKIPEYLVKKKYIKIKSSIILTFIIQFTYMFAIFLLIVVLGPYFSKEIFNSSKGMNAIVLIALSGLVMVIYNIFISAFQGLQKIKLYTMLNLSVYLLRFIFIIIFIPFGVLALPYSYVITAIIIALLSFMLFRYQFPYIAKAKTRITKQFSKEILYFSTPLMIGYVASSVVTNLDTILLSFFRSLEEVALYQVALPMANILLLVVGSITIVLMPLISELWTKKKLKTIRIILGLLTKALFLIIIPLALVLITFPENAINMLFGEIYLPAVHVLQILSFAMIISTLGYIFSSALIGIGKPILHTKISFTIMLTNIISNILLIPNFGIFGAAVSMVISNLIGFLLLSRFSIKYTGFSMQWFNMAKIIAGGLLMLAVISIIKTMLIMNPWIELIISLLSGFLVYTLFIFLTRAITRDELKLLQKLNLPIPQFLIRIGNRLLG